MTWAEFQIRSYGYNREQELDSLKLRKVGFAALWGFHSDPKKLPKYENKWWQIGNDDNGLSTEEREELIKAQTEAIKKAKLQHKKELENKANGKRE